MQLPEVEFQIFAVLSNDAVNNQSPLAENVAEITEPSCPSSLRRQLPMVVVQIIAVLSPEDVATDEMSLENQRSKHNLCAR